MIVSPCPDDGPFPTGIIAVSGWAWDEFGVAAVEVSIDGGRHWHRGALEPRQGFAWQRFEYRWAASVGEHRLMSRCTSLRGEAQPASGARNAVHEVSVCIADDHAVSDPNLP